MLRIARLSVNVLTPTLSMMPLRKTNL